MITSESFEAVLKKFKYQMVDGEIRPVLIDGDITDLVHFILSEAESFLIKGIEKEIETDPNEGDNGSIMDQYPEEFEDSDED